MASKACLALILFSGIALTAAAASADGGICDEDSLSLDLIISSMGAADEPADSLQSLDATLDYLSGLFDTAEDPMHPQVIGGKSYLMKKSSRGLRHDVVANISEFRAPVSGRISSKFGPRGDKGHMHRGIDIALSLGDTVCAAFPGRVELCGFDPRGYGYYVLMSHPNGLQTLYAHLDKFLVTPDITVSAGEPIALGGRTGNSTAPHLHFETRCQAVAIDPTEIADFATGRPRSATYVVKATAADKK